MVVLLFGPYSVVGYSNHIFYQCVSISSHPGNLKQDPTNLTTLTIDGGLYNWNIPSELIGIEVDITLVGGGGAGCAQIVKNEISRAGGGGSGRVYTTKVRLANSAIFNIGKGAPVFYTASVTHYNNEINPGSSYDGGNTAFTTGSTGLTALGGEHGKGGWITSDSMGGDGGSGGAASQYNGGTNGSNGGGTSSPLLGGAGQGSPLSFVDGILRAGGGGSASFDGRNNNAVSTIAGDLSAGNGLAAQYDPIASIGKNGKGGGGGGAATSGSQAWSGSGGSGTIILKVPIAQIKRKGSGVIII